MKLTQKHLIKGTQEFEIIDDYIRIRSKAPFKEEETLTVMLTVLNPEPVITSSSLNFTSRVNGKTLLSLYLGRPNAEEFNAFVGALKQKALEEYHAFAGLKPVNPTSRLGANLYDEPSDFETPDLGQPMKVRKNLDPGRIDEAIQMLKKYLNSEDTMPLLAAMEELKSDPKSERLQVKVINAFNNLGPLQGAVLTYAPYVGILMSDGPSGVPY